MALGRMREHGISSIFVVTRERRLAGIVLAKDALQAVKEHREEFKSIIIEDVPKVSIATPVIDVIPILAETKFPTICSYGKLPLKHLPWLLPPPLWRCR